jgi:hypothetical protein
VRAPAVAMWCAQTVEVCWHKQQSRLAMGAEGWAMQAGRQADRQVDRQAGDGDVKAVDRGVTGRPSS